MQSYKTEPWPAVVANRTLTVSDATRRNLPSLTSLRFFATAIVLLRHGSELFGFEKRFGLTDIGLWQGLTCFFVLSGFILTYCHPRLDDRNAVIKFIGARIARIWPSYAMAIVFYVLAFPPSVFIPGALPVLLSNLSLMQAWVLDRSHFAAFNTPSWSLSVEMFFYLCFPFLVRSLKTTWRSKLIASLLLALACIVFCTFDHFPNFPAYGSGCPPLINICPFSRLFEFVIGMIMGLLFLNTQQLKLKKSTATALECLAVICVALSIALPKLWELGDSWRCLEAVRGWIVYCGIAPVYASLIFLFAQERGAISKFLDKPLFVFLGETSFSLFLFHYPVYVFLAYATPILHSCRPWAATLCWVACTFLVSFINYKLIEVPCRRRILSALSAKLAANKRLALRSE